jgi:hypothetical protein
MLTFQSSKKDYMSDVPIPALEAEIKRVYEPNEAKAIIRSFHDMTLGSTVGKIEGKLAVYPCDVVAIFILLKAPIKFIDANGKELTLDGSGSGVYY